MIRALAVALSLAGTLALVPGAVSAGPQEAPRLNPVASSIVAEGRDRGRPRPLDIRLELGARMPFRVYLLDAPPRLVIEAQGLELPAAEPALPGGQVLPGLRWGPGLPGWSRIVAELPGTYRVDAASFAGPTTLAVHLTPVPAAEFAPRPDALTALRGLPQPADLPQAARKSALKVMIDPGHGGIDPGAQADGLSEAALMLDFARQVQAALAARGIAADLTRNDDSFLPLERRITVARAAEAGLLLSLHADLLPQGEAAGATIYVWDPQSNDRGARELAMRHDRGDLLGGVDLGDSDESVTRTLIELAQTDTQPRSLRFAKHLSSALNLAGVGLTGRPVRGAGFSVLKSADIPSVLLEVGFLSDPTDRARLADPAWREGAARAIARAIADWAEDDAAAAPGRRH